VEDILALRIKVRECYK